MKRLVGIVLVLLLMGCGGGAATVPEPAPDSAGEEPAPTATAAPAAQEEESAAATEAPPAGAEQSESSAEEEDAAAASTGDDVVYEGTDPATGMPVNPLDIPFGEPFIVRGELISANLTPQEEPEFVVRAPNGQTYRMGAQPLSEIYFEDGETQLEPYEFQRGLQVQATALMAADAGPSDILSTEDFTLLAAD